MNEENRPIQRRCSFAVILTVGNTIPYRRLRCEQPNSHKSQDLCIKNEIHPPPATSVNPVQRKTLSPRIPFRMTLLMGPITSPQDSNADSTPERV